MGLRFPVTRLSQKQFISRIKKDRYYVLTIKRKIIGTVAVKRRNLHWEIGALSIVPKYQRQGLGKRLLQFAEQKVRKLGAKRVYLFTLKNHPVLPSYYRRQGYKLINQSLFYNRKWIGMEKILSKNKKY